MKDCFKVLSISIVALILASPPGLGGVLSAYLGGLSEYKTEERPREAPPPSLRDYWTELVRKYPYPGRIMAKARITPSDLERVPEIYVKRHPYPELKGRRAKRLAAILKPYKGLIDEASARFGVPAEIIGGVILQESGGRPDAKAKTTSAKGLMQTIDATFKLAKRALAQQGIRISDPLNPRDSILAGSWYLSYCFDLARQDYPGMWNKSRLEHWSRALEYYYAGPAWGKNPRPIIHVYSNGRRLVIRKRAYSQSVLDMAKELG